MPIHSDWATPRNVADCIVQLIIDQYDFDSNEYDDDVYFLEPSCGTGVFVSSLISKGVPASNIIAIDIEQQFLDIARQSNPEVNFVCMDFLKDGVEYMKQFQDKTIVTIGNPPFSGTLGIQFVEYCKKFSSDIMFILPMGLIEPCKNRGSFIKNLCCVYPIYLRKFQDMTGQQDSTGSRPSCVYHWGISDDDIVDDDMNINLDYSLHFILRSR